MAVFCFLFFSWCGNHNALRAGDDMRLRLLVVCEKSGGLNDDVNIQLLPRQIRRLLFRKKLHSLAINYQGLALIFNRKRRTTIHRVVGEQICEILERA